MKNRLLSIDGALNFRDLGGYVGWNEATIKWGKVYRSGQLDRLKPSGVRHAASLGIGTVVDLRFDDEGQRYPTIKQAFPEARFISWLSELNESIKAPAEKVKLSWQASLDSGEVQQVREAMRLNYPAKLYSHQGVYRSLLLRLITDDAPVLFHCAAGKDRTGVAAALILGLLGVSEEDIVQDYLLSHELVSSILHSWVAGGAAGQEKKDDIQSRLAAYPRALVQPVFDADVSYIETLLEYVHKSYGCFENYALTTLKLSEADINALREKLLEY